MSYPCIQRALRTLKYAPSFYRHTLELIGTLRRAEVTRRFLLALTRGCNGLPPIEMKAHDPQNYVGDMLAFVYQSLNMEKEISRMLILDNDTVPNQLIDNNPIDDDVTIIKPMCALDMLSHALGGVARPLKARISQVLASLSRRNDDERSGDGDEEEHLRKNISEVYSICGLLLFYHSAVTKTMQALAKDYNKVDNRVQLLESITESLRDAANTYTTLLKVYGASLDTFSDKNQVTLASTLLSLIAEVRLASPGFDSGIALVNNIADPLSLDSLCSSIIEPSIISCTSLEGFELLRCSIIDAKGSGLSPTSIDHMINSIDANEQLIIDELVMVETKTFLNDCGLGNIYKSFSDSNRNPEAALSSHTGLDYDTLVQSFKVFYSSLYAPSLPSFNQVRDQEKRRSARLQAATKVSEFYKRIYDEITAENAGYPDVSFLGHNPEQVNILLSL